MKNFLFGTIFGLIICTAGVTGSITAIDRGLTIFQNFIKGVTG